MLLTINFSQKFSDYKLILVNIAVISVVAVILLVLNYFIRQKSNKMFVDQQKLSAYECGFEPFSEMHAHSIDVQFFLVSIMFLIFDIELALIFPGAIHLSFLGIFSFGVMVSFLIILTIGFAYEGQKGALNGYKAPGLEGVKKNNVPKSVIGTLGIPVDDETGDTIISTVSSGNINSLSYYFGGLTFEFILLIVLVYSLFYALYNVNKIAEYRIGIKVIDIVSASFVFIGLCYILFRVGLPSKLLFNGYFDVSGYTIIMKTFIVGSAAIVLQLSKSFVYYSRIIIGEYAIFIGLAVLFMVLLISSYNLISLFLCLEGLSLCLYILAAYEFDRKSSSEAAIKYFTMGAMSAGCLLFGIACIYGAVGSTAFIDMANWLAINSVDGVMVNNLVFGLGSLFVFYGLIFKAGAGPLHQGVPDVYEGIPNAVTAFFATVVKFTIIGLIIKVLPYISVGNPLILISALLSLIVGVFGALEVNKIKRFLAYTAINQVGLLILGIYVNAIAAVILYLFTYIITTVGFFVLLNGTKDLLGNREMVYISDLSNFTYYNQNSALLMIIILFAMAGLPPFVTAVGKWLIFYRIVQLDYYMLLFIAVLITIFSIYYYIRLVRSLFFEVEGGKPNKQAFIYSNTMLLKVVHVIIVGLVVGAAVFCFDFVSIGEIFANIVSY